LQARKLEKYRVRLTEVVASYKELQVRVVVVIVVVVVVVASAL
jgi:hypothetical protein